MQQRVTTSPGHRRSRPWEETLLYSRALWTCPPPPIPTATTSGHRLLLPTFLLTAPCLVCLLCPLIQSSVDLQPGLSKRYDQSMLSPYLKPPHRSIQHKAQGLTMAFKAFHVLAMFYSPASSMTNSLPQLFSLPALNLPSTTHFPPKPAPLGPSPAARLSDLPLTPGPLHMLFLLLKLRASVLT